jgi:hypothetical protein
VQIVWQFGLASCTGPGLSIDCGYSLVTFDIGSTRPVTSPSPPPGRAVDGRF